MTLLAKKIRRYYSDYYHEQLGLPNWQEWVNFRLKEEEFEQRKVARLKVVLGDFRGFKLLDVGCGTGGFLVEAQKQGAIVYGVEPSPEAVEICRLKGLKNVKIAQSEDLPYPDQSFELVYCYTVLEHVDNPKKALKEMIRVTKKNGRIYVQTPNYLSCYEGHYKVFWLPLFPKRLAALYLKLRGRKADFLQTINYLTPGKIRNYLRRQPIRFSLIKHQDRRTRGILRLPLTIFYTVFDIDPQIELIIKKK